MVLQLESLKREQAKREAALREVSAQVSAVEAAERQKREAEEQRARELAAAQNRLRAVQELIGPGFVATKIRELQERADGLADAVCTSDGSGELLMRLVQTSQELVTWERVAEILSERQAAYKTELQKMVEVK